MSLLEYLTGSLEKPGRAIRGVLGGRPQEAAAAVPFSDSLGLTDPADAVSGRDLLTALLGQDPGMAGGFAADLATDPLSYVGAGLLGKAGSVVMSGLGRTGGVANLLRHRRGFTILKDPIMHIGEPLVELPKVHLPELDRSVPELGGGLFNQEAVELGRTVVLRGPRLQTGYVPELRVPNWKNLGGDILGGGVNITARPVGGLPDSGVALTERTAQLREPLRIGGAMQMMNETAEGGVSHGFYSPNHKAAVAITGEVSHRGRGLGKTLDAGDVAETIRHESVHGIIDRAYRSGSTEGLPLPWRIAANLRNSNNRHAQALGLIAEEASAFGAGGAYGESGLGHFLGNPMPGYASQIEQLSPLIARLYREQKFHHLPLAAGAAAGAGMAGAAGAGLALTHLLGGFDE